MTWLIEFREEVKQASDAQLKLWIKYMALFENIKPMEKYASKEMSPIKLKADEQNREKYRELIYAEMKIRGIRRERSRERGKGKKETV